VTAEFNTRSSGDSFEQVKFNQIRIERFFNISSLQLPNAYGSSRDSGLFEINLKNTHEQRYCVEKLGSGLKLMKYLFK